MVQDSRPNVSVCKSVAYPRLSEGYQCQISRSWKFQDIYKDMCGYIWIRWITWSICIAGCRGQRAAATAVTLIISSWICSIRVQLEVSARSLLIRVRCTTSPPSRPGWRSWPSLPPTFLSDSDDVLVCSHYGDCHFREESLEKVTVVTSKRRSRTQSIQ